MNFDLKKVTEQQLYWFPVMNIVKFPEYLQWAFPKKSEGILANDNWASEHKTDSEVYLLCI